MKQGQKVVRHVGGRDFDLYTGEVSRVWEGSDDVMVRWDCGYSQLIGLRFLRALQDAPARGRKARRQGRLPA